MSKSRDQVSAEAQADRRRKAQEAIRDIVGIGAFSVFCFGLWLVYGTGWACIIGGAALFGLTIIGLLRRPTS